MLKEIESILRGAAKEIEAVIRNKSLANLSLRGELRRTKGKIGEALAEMKKRRKGPIQLCPAPGCKERAAPVFGMLCAKHKGAPKGTVAKWREARRAKKTKKAA